MPKTIVGTARPIVAAGLSRSVPVFARAWRLPLRVFDGIHDPQRHCPAIHVVALQHFVGLHGGLDIIGMC
ncbi:MAG: hypothetical protein IH877_08090 [Gemmatimonadetes bacterium]|nr:hypothetical protein [Gemmatimonadota bacterium]